MRSLHVDTAVGARLRLEGVGHTYVMDDHRVEALEAIDLTLQAGDRVVITGPSGSGKSTLLAIAGLMLTPGRGEAWLEGERMSHAPEADRERARLTRIGFVFQDRYLLPTLSARLNVALPLKAAGVARAEAEARADALLERVGLASRAEHRPHRLSGGEQQRVAVARALVHGPALVLADEPTTGLDRDNAAAVTGLLDDAARDGAAVLVVTHDLTHLPQGATLRHLRAGRLGAPA